MDDRCDVCGRKKACAGDSTIGVCFKWLGGSWWDNEKVLAECFRLGYEREFRANGERLLLCVKLLRDSFLWSTCGERKAHIEGNLATLELAQAAAIAEACK